MRHELEKTWNENIERVLAPVTDIYETEENYTMLMEMPGVEKENLDIVLEEDSLEIRGSVKPYTPENLTLKYSDCNSGNYYRKFRIGNDVDRNRIDASLSEGTLTLTLNKTEEVKPKKIAISAH